MNIEYSLYAGRQVVGAVISRGRIIVDQGQHILAALRAHAFTACGTVDATASHIVHRTLPTTALAIDANT